LKTNLTDNLNSLGARKGWKKGKNVIFLNRHPIVTHFSTSIFQGRLKNIIFRSVALVTESYGPFYIFFLTQTGLFTALYPTLCIKMIDRKIL